MLGSVIGDLFTEKCRFTDDTVCTMAVADALLNRRVTVSFQLSLLHWCRRYPNAGYGAAFKKWFESSDPQPYDSFGNGSAMRVSPVGFVVGPGVGFLDHRGHPILGPLDEVSDLARQTALPSHGHAEGVKGAQATACAVFLARTRPQAKEFIKSYIEKEFGYDLSTPLEVIRPTYGWDVTCQGSVPQAIRCFLESKDFVDCIRLAVSLGGDADTQAAIAGGIAQAYYKKIPEQMIVETFSRLPQHFVDLILRFSSDYNVPF